MSTERDELATCPSECAAGNHPGYEHDWWVEAFPVTAGAEGIRRGADTKGCDRAELADVISRALGAVTGIYDTSDKEDRELADAILAAGYRKPRVIAAHEELDDLPIGSIVMDYLGAAFQKKTRLTWSRHNRAFDYEAHDFNLPATVLYEPSDV